MSDNRGRNSKIRGRPKAPPNSQLFDDTSIGQGSYGYPQGYDYNNQPNNFYGQNYAQDNPQYANVPSYPGQQLFNDPMTNMAMQYGQALAGQGSELINKNIEEYVSKSNIKYYFAVDTAYVAKKLGLLVFPFAHKDWTLSHNQDGPVAPRFDVNARDLYIPVMAFVTYTLLAGVLLGMQHKFSPEQLGVISSTALVWTVLEMLLLLITKSILNIPSGNNSPSYLDWLACCGYKYVGIIIALLASIPFFSTGYYASLAWMSFSIAFFLVKSLRVSILGHPDAGTFELASKRRLYMLLLVAIIQPVLMWWLTRKIAILEPLEESFD